MDTKPVIPWNPKNDFSSNETLKMTYASRIAADAAKKANELNSANEFAKKNDASYQKFSSLDERGGKIKKKRSSKRRKGSKGSKRRKTRRHTKRR